MPQKYVYISMDQDGGPEDMQFFDSVEGLYLDYEAHALVRELTKFEFMEAINDTEMVEEGGHAWYRDILISVEEG